MWGMSNLGARFYDSRIYERVGMVLSDNDPNSYCEKICYV